MIKKKASFIFCFLISCLSTLRSCVSSAARICANFTFLWIHTRRAFHFSPVFSPLGRESGIYTLLINARLCSADRFFLLIPWGTAGNLCNPCWKKKKNERQYDTLSLCWLLKESGDWKSWSKGRQNKSQDCGVRSCRQRGSWRDHWASWVLESSSAFSFLLLAFLFAVLSTPLFFSVSRYFSLCMCVWLISFTLLYLIFLGFRR